MPPISKLLLPPPDLAGCLMAGLYRDTRGANLCDADRMNHFPASPLVAITLVLHGSLHILPAGTGWQVAEQTPPLPRKSAHSPQEAPVTSWAQGDVVALAVGIYPDAWRALGGDGACSALPSVLSEALEAFDATGTAAEGWAALCKRLETAWRAARPDSWRPVARISDWSAALATRAAFSGTGRSLRSIERKIKRYSGHTQRSLAFYSNVEKLHEHSRRSAGQPLAEIAIEAGYSDQSHMGRALRRATGFSPARLNKAIETEEAFWCYRLLGERF
ncbi:helix-turn-helix domain-containing protein [Celeribacter baekdonensis]|uniref:AraC family transcriptional regulator n=1 Tax=Celeribacter baekdonensis TaxID=875171 RepID=UPI0030D939B8